MQTVTPAVVVRRRSGVRAGLGTLRCGLLVALASLAPAAVAAADVGLKALEATFRIHGGGQSGTAFLVALPGAAGGEVTSLLVTAAHAVEKIPGDTATAVLRAEAGGAWQRRDTPLAIRASGKPLWVRHPTADLAVLPWSPPAGVGLVPLARLATAASFDEGRVRVGQRVWVACFPAQTEGHAAGWPVLRGGSIATHPLAPAAGLERFFVDYAHFGGDSGSAVVVDDGGEPLVAGVVVAMQRQTDRVTSPFEEKTLHTPLGLAIAVPAPRLHETIERWRSAAASAAK